MERSLLRAQVRERLAGRQLVFFGTRADDVEGVGDLPELTSAFSMIGAYRRRAALRSVALEDFTRRRVDLDVSDIDDEPSSGGIVELRRLILRTLSSQSVVFTYRPSGFLSAVCFARRDRCTYAGMFKDHQAAFEHKPWVESSLRDVGIPVLPWVYVADEEQLDTLRYLSDGPVVLRRSHSSGGTGLTKVESPRDLARSWPAEREHFVSVAPYIAGATPTNVGGVVWNDGITLHPPSVQLIGIVGCTERSFGYCGNDFSAARCLTTVATHRMEASTKRIGEWLHSFGYRGAFGVDFLVNENQVFFTEVNPRLQGVTHLSCQLSASEGESCIMLEHLGALLGLPSPPSRPLGQQVSSLPKLSHLVLHHLGPERSETSAERMSRTLLGWSRVRRTDVVCPAGIAADPGATLLRVTIADQITTTGYELHAPWQARLSSLADPTTRGLSA